MNKWHQGKVVEGNRFGVKIGFPTLNINNPDVLKEKTAGVYACQVKIKNRVFKGVLYFGPRVIRHEEKNSLEIFVFDFNEMIYGRTISFQLLNYLRPPLKFDNFKALKAQLIKDCRKAKEILSNF